MSANKIILTEYLEFYIEKGPTRTCSQWEEKMTAQKVYNYAVIWQKGESE